MSCENQKEITEYWAKNGPRFASFLLVIPGVTIAGVGVGLILDELLGYSVLGFGLGLTLWGLVAVFARWE